MKCLRRHVALLVLVTGWAGSALALPVCQQTVASLKQMDTARAYAGGCPPKAPPKHILTKAPKDPPDSTEHCVPNSTKLAVWDQQNKQKQQQLLDQLHQCNVEACPVIEAIPPCVCPAGTPLAACACRLTADSDGDGIPDYIERELIEKYSPFLRFTKRKDGGDDAYRPIDPLAYIALSRLLGPNSSYSSFGNSTENVVLTQAQLAATPELMLGMTSDGPASLMNRYTPNNAFTACENPRPKADLYLEPIAASGAYFGAQWSEVTDSRNVGIFAHVSPLKPLQAGDLPGLCPRFVNDSCKNGKCELVIPPSWYEANCTDCVKIEYYQFFGKNSDNAPFMLGDHEGDWSIVTVVYGTYQGKKQAVSVSHWAHGYEMRFNLTAATDAIPSIDPIVGKQVMYLGSRSQYTDFSLADNFGRDQDQPERGQDNKLIMAIDEVSGEYTHPVAYVEVGSHELWPTSGGSVSWAPAHNGDDVAHSLLTHNIPNLGELEHPMGDAAKVILGYAGSWGFRNTFNDPPPGPALHKAWNWWTPHRPPIACTAAE